MSLSHWGSVLVGLWIWSWETSELPPTSQIRARPAACSRECARSCSGGVGRGPGARGTGSQRWGRDGGHAPGSPHGLGSLDSRGVALSSLGSQGEGRGGDGLPGLWLSLGPGTGSDSHVCLDRNRDSSRRRCGRSRLLCELWPEDGVRLMVRSWKEHGQAQL